MNKEVIKICGKEIAVTFNIGTLLDYEEEAGKSFFAEKFEKFSERAALIAAAAKSATGTDISDDLKSIDSFEDFNKAFEVVDELSRQFFKLPKVVADAESREAETVGEDKGDSAKN